MEASPFSGPQSAHLNSFCESFASQRVSKIAEVLHSLLPDLQDAQMATYLLQSCLSLPKLVFLLRTIVPPFTYRLLCINSILFSRRPWTVLVLGAAQCPNGPGTKLHSPALLVVSTYAKPPPMPLQPHSVSQSRPLVSEILGSLHCFTPWLPLQLH